MACPGPLGEFLLGKIVGHAVFDELLRDHTLDSILRPEARVLGIVSSTPGSCYPGGITNRGDNRSFWIINYVFNHSYHVPLSSQSPDINASPCDSGGRKLPSKFIKNDKVSQWL